MIGRAISVPMLRKSFRLSIRRLAAHLEHGMPLNLTPVEDAAEAVAAREEETIYLGQADFGLDGLLTAKGRNQHRRRQTGPISTRCSTDVIAAVTKLDDVGLSRALRAGAFARRSTTACSATIPAPTCCSSSTCGGCSPRHPSRRRSTAALVVDPRVGPLLVGQDLSAGYIAQDGIHYELYLSESIVLRLDEPQAICTITPKL